MMTVEIQLQRHGERLGCCRGSRAGRFTPATPLCRPSCRRSARRFVSRWLNRDPLGAWSVPEKHNLAIRLLGGSGARRWVLPSFEREPRSNFWFALNDPVGQVDTEGQWVLGAVAAAAAVYNLTLSAYEGYEFIKCMLQHYETQKMAARLEARIPATACSPVVDNPCWPLLGDALTHFVSGASWGITRMLLIRSGFNPINILRKIGGG